jgi:Trypsin
MKRFVVAVLASLFAMAIPAGSAEAIIGGTTTSAESWPWAVQVGIVQEGTLTGFCGGALVAPRRVVTVGSCVNGIPTTDVLVLANDKELIHEGAQFTQVASITLAPSWASTTSTDVAVLDLINAVSPANPIQILEPGESSDFPSPATALVAGWGFTTASPSADLSSQLRQASVGLSIALCGPVEEGIRCSESTHEPCSGDTGDPVSVQIGADTVTSDPSPANGTWRLVALPLFGVGGECEFTGYVDLTQPAIRSFITPSPPAPGPGGGVGGASSNPPPAAIPDTKITKAKVNSKKHTATFRFKATGDSTGFQCALRKKKARKKPSFKSCRSPKTYRNLAPGGYTFEVRATGPAGADKSPAKRSFTVAAK